MNDHRTPLHRGLEDAGHLTWAHASPRRKLVAVVELATPLQVAAASRQHLEVERVAHRRAVARVVAGMVVSILALLALLVLAMGCGPSVPTDPWHVPECDDGCAPALECAAMYIDTFAGDECEATLYCRAEWPECIDARLDALGCTDDTTSTGEDSSSSDDGSSSGASTWSEPGCEDWCVDGCGYAGGHVVCRCADDLGCGGEGRTCARPTDAIGHCV